MGHFALGLMLILPGFRFLAGLLQFPRTIGIVAFHLMLFPLGLPLAFAMLSQKLGVHFDPLRMRSLLPPATSNSNCDSPALV